MKVRNAAASLLGLPLLFLSLGFWGHGATAMADDYPVVYDLEPDSV